MTLSLKINSDNYDSKEPPGREHRQKRRHSHRTSRETTDVTNNSKQAVRQAADMLKSQLKAQDSIGDWLFTLSLLSSYRPGTS